MQRHMNRAHSNLSCTEINSAESANRSPTDIYTHNRWVSCTACHSTLGTHRHFLGVRGLRLHDIKSHQRNQHPAAQSSTPAVNVPARRTARALVTLAPPTLPTARTASSASSRPTPSSPLSLFFSADANPSNRTTNSMSTSSSLLHLPSTVPRSHAVTAVWPRSAPSRSAQPPVRNASTSAHRNMHSPIAPASSRSPTATTHAPTSMRS